MRSVPTLEFSIETGHGRIFARRWGLPPDHEHDPASIVLFHDSLGCVDLWRDFPEGLALATGRSVVAYDRLGFGRSDPHPGALGARFVHDEARGSFRALCEELEMERFIGFGHSVGGGMAVVCAATYATECRALITESAQTFVEDRTIEGILAARRAFEQPDQLDRLRRYHGDKAAWVLSAWIDTWLDPDFANWNLDDDLRRLRCPVLAIHGDSDEYGSVLHPRRMAERTSGRASVEILRDCGHVPHREQSAGVLDIVTRWLTDVD